MVVRVASPPRSIYRLVVEVSIHEHDLLSCVHALRRLNKDSGCCRTTEGGRRVNKG